MFKYYRKRAEQPMRPYVEGEDITGVSISDFDRKNGSPLVGDMIAHNPKDPNDRWLIAKEYFELNFIEV